MSATTLRSCAKNAFGPSKIHRLPTPTPKPCYLLNFCIGFQYKIQLEFAFNTFCFSIIFQYLGWKWINLRTSLNDKVNGMQNYVYTSKISLYPFSILSSLDQPSVTGWMSIPAWIRKCLTSWKIWKKYRSISSIDCSLEGMDPWRWMKINSLEGRVFQHYRVCDLPAFNIIVTTVLMKFQ